MSGRVGIANGCFDLLHDGHRHLIRECQMRCEKLIVALNSDQSVERLKGKPRPIRSALTRKGDVTALLRPRDRVIIFDTEDDLRKLIATSRADVIFKGADYRGKPVTGSDLAPVELLPLLDGYSTTKTLNDRLA